MPARLAHLVSWYLLGRASMFTVVLEVDRSCPVVRFRTSVDSHSPNKSVFCRKNLKNPAPPNVLQSIKMFSIIPLKMTNTQNEKS